jgi:hypothetical protein
MANHSAIAVVSRTTVPRRNTEVVPVTAPPIATGASPLARTRGVEEVDKQLVDAFTVVVMHPVRRVGQVLDAVEVGYISRRRRVSTTTG